MATLRILTTCFAERALSLRRLYAQDARFRAICDDFEEARAAQLRWEQAGAASRAEDYRQVAAELEAEIRAQLEDAAAARPRRG